MTKEKKKKERETLDIRVGDSSRTNEWLHNKKKRTSFWMCRLEISERKNFLLAEKNSYTLSFLLANAFTVTLQVTACALDLFTWRDIFFFIHISIDTYKQSYESQVNFHIFLLLFHRLQKHVHLISLVDDFYQMQVQGKLISRKSRRRASDKNMRKERNKKKQKQKQWSQWDTFAWVDHTHMK